MTPAFILGMIIAAMIVSGSISVIKKESYNEAVGRFIFVIIFNLLIGFFIFGLDI
jgi:hypothetical protein